MRQRHLALTGLLLLGTAALSGCTATPPAEQDCAILRQAAGTLQADLATAAESSPPQAQSGYQNAVDAFQGATSSLRDTGVQKVADAYTSATEALLTASAPNSNVTLKDVEQKFSDAFRLYQATCPT